MTDSGRAVTVLERISRVAPLGIRFWDGATNRFVGSDLAVSAFPPGRPDRRLFARASSAGVYGFPLLPGLPAPELYGAGDDDYWQQVRTRTWTIEVFDPVGRFLPCTFPADAPARGLFATLCAQGSPVGPLPPEFLLGSPLALPPSCVPLFSAPTRPVPAGMAAARAELVDVERGRPASWALLQVRPPRSSAAWGMADGAGRVLVILPYPAPARTLLDSPPGSPPFSSAARPLWEQVWPVDVAAYSASPGSPLWGEQPGEQPSAPDLCAVLAQPPADLWLTRAPPQLFSTETLVYGRELVLRSLDGPAGRPLPQLFLSLL
jgi:hypothetical protein